MKNCPICSSQVRVKKIFENLPNSSALLEHTPTKNKGNATYEALICDNCGHISNSSPSRFTTSYSDQRYVVKKSVSSTMSANLKNIIKFMTPSENLVGFKILEIGSGSGEVATWFANQGVTIDTVDPAVAGYENSNITHYQQNFDDTFDTGKKYDLVIARHIIEHTEDPTMFLRLCYSMLNETGTIYLEVPDLSNTLTTLRIVDFFNDHIQYFTKHSLATLAHNNGLQEIKTASWLNDAHMGMLLGKRHWSIEVSLEAAEEKFKKVMAKLEDANCIAIYGAGAHACTFASQLRPDIAAKVKYVFDKSTDKQGRYIPGIAVPITSPANNEQDLIVNTSSLYVNEVEKYLVDELGYTCTIVHL
jgi:2-polyprenyl-3-methyl-5-hydroxy-6-metoxy-1,4-benzoquinol methylase